jgi:hypothetical protein
VLTGAFILAWENEKKISKKEEIMQDFCMGFVKDPDNPKTIKRVSFRSKEKKRKRRAR